MLSFNSDSHKCNDNFLNRLSAVHDMERAPHDHAFMRKIDITLDFRGSLIFRNELSREFDELTDFVAKIAQVLRVDGTKSKLTYKLGKHDRSIIMFQFQVRGLNPYRPHEMVPLWRIKVYNKTFEAMALLSATSSNSVQINGTDLIKPEDPLFARQLRECQDCGITRVEKTFYFYTFESAHDWL